MQLSVKLYPPDKSVRLDHPTAHPRTFIRMDTDLLFYIFLGFKRVMDYPFFSSSIHPTRPTIILKLNQTLTHLIFFSLTYFLPLPHLIFLSLSHIFCRRLPHSQPPSLPSSFAPTPPSLPCLHHSHASITAPLPHGTTPSQHHSLTASLRQSLTSRLTPSQSRFVNLSPHVSLRPIPRSLTASPRQIPRFPHGLTRSDPSLHSDLVCGFDFVFRLDFFVVLIWFLC